MNKIFIALLIVAAAAGVYFFLQKKKTQPVTDTLHKEWILGKWKTNSITPARDSLAPLYLYEYQQNGMALRQLNDSAKADTLYYNWNAGNNLVIKSGPKDSTGLVYVIQKLTKDTLQTTGPDSLNYLFTRIK